MNHLKRFLVGAAAAVTLAAGGALPALADPMVLEWDDLIPKDYELTNPLSELSDEEYSKLADGTAEAERLMSELRAAWDNAPVVEELDGQSIRLPGFVVPLDFEAEKVSEFLLVPYFGACIHVPPPPANQVVFVRFDDGVEIEALYDAVWVEGTMQTARMSSSLAEAGYTLNATGIKPYENPDQ